MDDATGATAVVGLVDPLAGAAGVHDAGTDTWTFVLRLLHWQVDGFPLADGPLALWEAGLDRDELEERMHAATAGAVVTAPVLLGDALAGHDDPSARLVGELADAAPSAALAAARDEVRREVVVDHEVARVVFRHEWQAFRGRVAWVAGEVEVEVELEVVGADAGAARTALDRLGPWLADGAAHDARYRQVAADALLDTLNDTWIDPDQPVVTEAEFLRRLAPRTLVVGADGAEVAVAYDDDGLFWGRAVVVEGTLADGPTDASL